MSLYLIVLIVCVGGVCVGCVNTKLDGILYKIEMLILGMMLCFRYGQGTDYFGYALNYFKIPANIDIDFLLQKKVHGELGYNFVVMVFRTLGAPIEVFVFFLSFAMMAMTYHAIKKYAGMKTMAVLLLYPTYYLTFYFSGIRQGFALAYTLCFVLPAWEKNKKIKYAVLVLAGLLIHKSMIALLIPLFVGKFVRKHEKISLFLSCVFAIIVSILLKTVKFNYYYIDDSPSVGAIILRIILYAAIAGLYKRSKEYDNISERLYEMYLTGFCIYICLCPLAFTAHRFTAYMKIMEILLISRLISGKLEEETMRKVTLWTRRNAMLLFTSICVVESIKNMESYPQQASYTSQTHFYNYPYISVFNESKIYQCRSLDSVYSEIDSYWKDEEEVGEEVLRQILP